MEKQTLTNQEDEDFTVFIYDKMPTIKILNDDGDVAYFTVYNQKQVGIIQNFLYQIQDHLKNMDKAGETALPVIKEQKVKAVEREENWQPKTPKLTPSIDLGLNKDKKA